jgi:hypothetical protein
MDGGLGDEALEERVRAILRGAVQELRESGARTEALAEYRARKPILGIARAPVMVPKGRVWRLGVLLLDESGGLHTIGTVTRAVDPGRVTNQSERAEIRRDHRRAAFQATFAEGDTVNFDTSPVPTDAASIRATDPSRPGPVSADPADPARNLASGASATDAAAHLLALGADGTVLVRWNLQPGSTAFAPLESYLAERADLLTAPPP